METSTAQPETLEVGTISGVGVEYRIEAIEMGQGVRVAATSGGGERFNWFETFAEALGFVGRLIDRQLADEIPGHLLTADDAD